MKHLAGLVGLVLLMLVVRTPHARADESYELGAIPVCVRPPDVPAGLNAWAYTPGSTVLGLTQKEFEERIRGKTAHYYDPSAPAESVKLLPIVYHHLKCAPYAPPVAVAVPKKVEPKPDEPAGTGGKGKGQGSGDSGEGSGDKASKEATKKAGDGGDKGPPPGTPPPIVYPKEDTKPKPRPGGVTAGWTQTVLPMVRRQPVLPWQKTGGVTAHWPRQILPLPRYQPILPSQKTHGVTAHWPSHVLPWKDSSPGAQSGGGQGGKGKERDSKAVNHVAAKTWLDKVAEQSAFAGAIANQLMNEDIHRPDGKQYGIPGGQAKDGPNHPVAQLTAGAVLVAMAVLPARAGKLKKLLDKAAAKDAERLLYKEMSELGKDAMEELAKKLGPVISKTTGETTVRTAAAEVFHKNGSIGPYDVMKQFTDKLGGKYQAHHILEKSMAKRFKLGDPDMVPSVLLTEAQHKKLTAELALETRKVNNPQDLWLAYQKVYVDHPDWLKAIKLYFIKDK